MSTVLKSVPATVSADGTVTLSEPLNLNEDAQAVLTVAVEVVDKVPNAETIAAMAESTEGLAEYDEFDDLVAALRS